MDRKLVTDVLYLAVGIALTEPMRRRHAVAQRTARPVRPDGALPPSPYAAPAR
ncbi:MAG: hypothetical protein JWN54_2415 [Mycobacterium sp.]|nr:hypothetical protein [Mycobacterium sp.]